MIWADNFLPPELLQRVLQRSLQRVSHPRQLPQIIRLALERC